MGGGRRDAPVFGCLSDDAPLLEDGDATALLEYVYPKCPGNGSGSGSHDFFDSVMLKSAAHGRVRLLNLLHSRYGAPSAGAVKETLR
jgi:hypothetical protein